jgi:hypothetical protein
VSAPKASWYPDPGKVAVTDANGVNLGYAGPDGRTLYYRGFPVQTAREWAAIRAEQEAAREAVKLEG